MPVLLFVLDQALKIFIRRQPLMVPLFGLGPFQFVHFENTAGPFSAQIPFFILLILHAAVLFIAGYSYARFPHTRKGLSWILSGGLSNFLDRIFIGSTTDYLGLPFHGYWNLADICVLLGIFLILRDRHPQRQS